MSNLSKLLSRSGTLAQQGDLAGARAELEKAVRDHGRRAEPWISLAAIHGMGGNYTEALRCARKAVELAPNSLQAWVNLGNAAESSGDLTQTADAFQRARRLPGCPLDIELRLGLTLEKLGGYAEAEGPLREYLSRHPGHQEATLALGTVLARKGDSQAAVALTENYCQQHPTDVRALYQLGITYLDMGNIEDAQRVCDQTERMAPDDADALFLKAILLMFEGRYSEARDVYERIDHLQPGSPQTLILLSEACQQAGDKTGAIAYARAALKIDPRNVNALITLSHRLLNKDVTEAHRLMLEAESIAPHDLSVMVTKGSVLQFEGDKQGAWEAVRTVIESGSPSSGAALIAAAVGPAIGKTAEVIEMLENAVTRTGISITEQRKLRFALASVCDKAKHYDRAFEHADTANRLKNAWCNSNARTVGMNRLKSVYTATLIDSLPRSNIRSELPVFIVGMPRSGTSLLEQILSCHSKVHARGETTDVRTLTEGIPYYPDGVRNLTQEKLDAMASAYIAHLNELAPSATRITDKLPGNYSFLGIISQLFPGARIINCRRDPRDVCLSNYFIEFDTGHVHSYNLESLALACKGYQDLMTHWKQVLPIPILDVRYEDLIADPRTWVAKVLEFCGLEWEDACLNFHKSDRQVVTASYDQVRKPLYNTSVARWKHYERQLEPVSRILGLHDDSYP